MNKRFQLYVLEAPETVYEGLPPDCMSLPPSFDREAYVAVLQADAQPEEPVLVAHADSMEEVRSVEATLTRIGTRCLFVDAGSDFKRTLKALREGWSEGRKRRERMAQLMQSRAQWKVSAEEGGRKKRKGVSEEGTWARGEFTHLPSVDVQQFNPYVARAVTYLIALAIVVGIVALIPRTDRGAAHQRDRVDPARTAVAENTLPGLAVPAAPPSSPRAPREAAATPAAPDRADGREAGDAAAAAADAPAVPALAFGRESLAAVPTDAPARLPGPGAGGIGDLEGLGGGGGSLEGVSVADMVAAVETRNALLESWLEDGQGDPGALLDVADVLAVLALDSPGEGEIPGSLGAGDAGASSGATSLALPPSAVAGGDGEGADGPVLADAHAALLEATAGMGAGAGEDDAAAGGDGGGAAVGESADAAMLVEQVQPSTDALPEPAGSPSPSPQPGDGFLPEPTPDADDPGEEPVLGSVAATVPPDASAISRFIAEGIDTLRSAGPAQRVRGHVPGTGPVATHVALRRDRRDDEVTARLAAEGDTVEAAAATGGLLEVTLPADLAEQAQALGRRLADCRAEGGESAAAVPGELALLSMLRAGEVCRAHHAPAACFARVDALSCAEAEGLVDGAAQARAALVAALVQRVGTCLELERSPWSPAARFAIELDVQEAAAFLPVIWLRSGAFVSVCERTLEALPCELLPEALSAPPVQLLAAITPPSLPRAVGVSGVSP